ncbi:MAG TPA: LuxR C-terminal-related transcriptional regulator [Trebonia sp.]|jgi:non-specific serine/threonine protein kinase|nr:LuxR C-terminal-related transcriptional regulator [Trebonia sp.]
MTSAALDRAAAGERRRDQLPAEVTGFVGRKAELARISALLATARLVTVVGPGGVGKTRVAHRAALRAADRYRDGIRLVELSQLRDPALLPNTVAACLGLPEQHGGDQLAAVLDHLRDSNLLLLLDTCEHLVDACAILADAVLGAAPDVTLLATSRQPLDVPGEHTFPVAPLPVPDPDAPVRLEPLADCGDAVELFAQRAAAAVPGFQVTAANRTAVTRLCQRLDGIPLAIELAAVRLRALPLPELSERLENRFNVLTGGRRGTVPRHQTLRTAIEWSHELCTPTEQALWARLSVFAGAFDMATAERVCAGPGVARQDLVQTLIGLIDKSVVLREGPEGTRYRLLDTLREFGAQRLTEAGQETDYRGRHVTHYLGLARQFRDNFLGDQQVNRFRELRREHANLRAALEYALDTPACQETRRDGAELATALYGYWAASGLLQEGRYWLGKVLDRFPQPWPERAGALVVRGYLSGFAGEIRQAVDEVREGITIAEALGAAGIRARGYLYLNIAQTFGGWHAEATAAGAEAERQLAEVGDQAGLLFLDTQMAHLHQLAGRPDLAIARCEQGLDRFGASRERWLHGYLYTVASLAYFQQPGKENRCVDAAIKGLRAKHELGDNLGIAYAFEVLAWVAAGADRFERTAWLTGAADPLWHRTGKRLSGTEIMEEFHQRAVKAASDALGEKRFAALRAQGAAQPLDQVVAAAIGDADELMRGQATAVPRGGASPVGPQAGLTGREQEIAALVASGLSNRDIAAKLVISKRTVDAHVEHIFAKLGISSRVQLTIWLREQLPRARDGASEKLPSHHRRVTSAVGPPTRGRVVVA